MSINFNVSHISYRFYCDKLSSIDLSKNLIIESSANNIEFKSNNRNISFNNSTIFKVQIGASNKKLDLVPSNFKGLKSISMIQGKRIYKYMYHYF